MTSSVWVWVADAVLILHFAFVLFVAGGLVLIVAGNVRDWRFVNGFWFRLLHLSAILMVVLEAWLGMVCPLTTLENRLRLLAGADGYATSFIEHWVSTVLFFDLPQELFTFIYSLFGLLVVLTWWKFPPGRTGEDV